MSATRDSVRVVIDFNVDNGPLYFVEQETDGEYERCYPGWGVKSEAFAMAREIMVRINDRRRRELEEMRARENGGVDVLDTLYPDYIGIHTVSESKPHAIGRFTVDA